MTVLLGGRAAESLFFPMSRPAPRDDLAKATEIARSMVVRFGMDPKLGQVAYETESASFLGGAAGADWRPRRYGDATADAIDTAVRALIEDAFHSAVAILGDNRELLDKAAKELLEKETFAAEELKRVAQGLAHPAAREAIPSAGLAAAGS